MRRIQIDYNVHDYDKSRRQGVTQLIDERLTRRSQSVVSEARLPFQIIQRIAYHRVCGDVQRSQRDTLHYYERYQHVHHPLQVVEIDTQRAENGGNNAGDKASQTGNYDNLFIIEFLVQQRHYQHRSEHTYCRTDLEQRRNGTDTAGVSFVQSFSRQPLQRRSDIESVARYVNGCRLHHVSAAGQYAHQDDYHQRFAMENAVQRAVFALLSFRFRGQSHSFLCEEEAGDKQHDPQRRRDQHQNHVLGLFRLYVALGV